VPVFDLFFYIYRIVVACTDQTRPVWGDAINAIMRRQLYGKLPRQSSLRKFFSNTVNNNNSKPESQSQRQLPRRDIAHSQFNVLAVAPRLQLLAWRNRVGHVIDVLPSRKQLEEPFKASIDSYQVGDLMLTDCRSDAITMERSLARISTDNIRNYAFHLFLEGGVTAITHGYRGDRREQSHVRSAAGPVASILALDMDQPVSMRRDACRMLTLFVPRTLVDALLPDAESIHGRVFTDRSAQTLLLIDHMAALNQNLPAMSAMQADSAMRIAMTLLIAAFGKQAGLQGSARAAIRAAMFGKARRHIQQHLHQAELSPQSIVDALQLPRRTLYRMFEHEGGLEAYVRGCKLRAAADDLVRFPQRSVLEVAYGLGFKSASHFTRSFHRAHDMAPQDFRMQAMQRRNIAAVEK
jgi:AraC-like DNA-binding protein